jgi:hypothetical protein
MGARAVDLVKVEMIVFTLSDLAHRARSSSKINGRARSSLQLQLDEKILL